MKKQVLILAALMCTVTAVAQKLVIGEKAPDIRAAEWLWGRPADGKARFIEFFHGGSSQCTDRLTDIASLAVKLGDRMDVILVSRETAENILKATGDKSGTYFAAVDDGGKTFEAYSVRFVPFGVLVDRKGRILWFGNPASLAEQEIVRLLN
ncbi:MAG: redoxin domain-containing protein [Alistipes sp.]|nr:redoxin domain-containing protein [Alistipes sp.]